MTPELTKKLARIEAACRKVLELDAEATKDWTIDPDIQRRDWEPRRPSGSVSVGRDIWSGMSCDDAAFIAYSRTITPDMAKALLSQIEKHKEYANRPAPHFNRWIHDYAIECLQSIADSFPETSLQ